MGIYSDNNTIYMDRMGLDSGKRVKTIAPISGQRINTNNGKMRLQSRESRQRVSGTASGIRGVNTRLENTGKESKLINVSKREFIVRRRKSPHINLLRTPHIQDFYE